MKCEYYLVEVKLGEVSVTYLPISNLFEKQGSWKFAIFAYGEL